MIYTVSQIQKQLPDLLKKAAREGQIQFKAGDEQIFVIRPVILEKASKASPLDVRSVKLPISTNDILLAVRESRARYM